MMRRGLAGLLLLALVTGFATSDSAAWSNGGYSADFSNPDYGTHDWIVDQALAIQTRDVGFMKTAYHARLLLGTEAPDNPDFIGDTGEHHVYYRSTGAVQDDSSALRAASIYENALAYLKAGDYEETAYCVGVMAHYISDPGVFGHTMGSYTDWGAEVHHSDYENHLQTLTGSLSSSDGLTLGNASAYDATLELAESVTFGAGEIMSNIWMDSHYSWSDLTFEESSMASLDAAVWAVASVVNHLMVEANSGQTPPPPTTPPSLSPPTGLTAVWKKGSGVILTWSPPSSGGTVSSYVIYRGTDLGSRDQLTTVSSGILTWTDERAESGITYYYWVASSDSAAISDLTLPATVAVPRGGPSAMVAAAVGAACSVIVAAVGAILLRNQKNHRVGK